MHTIYLVYIVINMAAFKGVAMEILLVILDLDPGRWDSTAHLLNASKALLTFLSLYLAQNQSISVHLYLAHHGKADLAWSSDGSIKVPYDKILSHIQGALLGLTDAEKSGVASALIKGLCRYNRIRTKNPANTVRTRFLILTPGTFDATNYVALMNASFCAQKSVFIWKPCKTNQTELLSIGHPNRYPAHIQLN